MTARRQAGLAQAYDEARPRLVRVAYAVLGSNTDAEDVVSDGWPRLIAADDREPILDLGAWATPTVARLALDLLQSARVRREQYVGPWLPEPIVQGTADPADRVTLDSRSASRRWWCSRRSAPPNGRPGCSTICSGWGSPRLPTSSGGPAARSGRSPRPAPCRRAVARARPGGCVDQRWRRPVNAARRPVIGADRVARFILGIAGNVREGQRLEPVSVNGSMGLALYDGGTARRRCPRSPTRRCVVPQYGRLHEPVRVDVALTRRWPGIRINQLRAALDSQTYANASVPEMRCRGRDAVDGGRWTVEPTTQLSLCVRSWGFALKGAVFSPQGRPFPMDRTCRAAIA